MTGCSGEGNSNGDGGDGGCEFEWAQDTQSGTVIARVEDRDLTTAHVIRDGCGMTMWAGATRLGNSQIYVFNSDDGFHWDDGVPISFSSGDIPGFRPYVIKQGSNAYTMYYQTRQNMEQPVGTANEIGMAISSDGKNWHDEKVVYSGAGLEVDDQLLSDPAVWCDGELFHLIYTGWTEQTVGDQVFSLFSILHATSVDGTSFEFDSILFQAEACQGSPAEYSQWTIQDVIRSTDPECPSSESAFLLIQAKHCSQDWQLYISQLSSDGSVGNLIPLGVDTNASSSVLVGRDLWLFGSKDIDGRYQLVINRTEIPIEVDLECP